jgi:uncharacterized protein with ACT and thioredoxin-like domain
MTGGMDGDDTLNEVYWKAVVVVGGKLMVHYVTVTAMGETTEEKLEPFSTAGYTISKRVMKEVQAYIKSALKEEIAGHLKR